MLTFFSLYCCKSYLNVSDICCVRLHLHWIWIDFVRVGKSILFVVCFNVGSGIDR